MTLKAKNSPAPGRQWIILCLLIAVTLACATNTPVAQLALPRPTRTPFPTFTLTPIPPTPLPTPTATNTVPPTDTPLPTNTPVVVADVPTNTPVPTDTPPPTHTPRPAPPPPTHTPVPSPTPVPVATSPLPTPTATAEPGTPPGRYEVSNQEGQQNCFDVGVTGKVKDKGNDNSVQWVTIEVRGDKDGYKGPFVGKTDAEGKYNIYIGPLDKVGDIKLNAKVIGANVVSEDKPEWTVKKDCDANSPNQIMKINWDKKSL